MSDLIEALQIFLKYGNSHYPTIGEHDELIICDISPDQVSQVDQVRLKELGFIISDDCFKSFRYGSA